MCPAVPLPEPGDFPPLRRRGVEVLQVNLGYRCNQTCAHCHVDAGPHRSETMSRETAQRVLRLLAATGARTLDLTGGAPELHAQFRFLVESARERGVHVIDRSNLTVLEEPGMEGLVGFLAARQVEIIASLPCYLEENVDAQRGRGVFEASIRALGRLNRLGYGRPGTGLVLNLVYNPQGPSLPPPQETLEADYRAHLGGSYGIQFNRLLTLANMPIRRFGQRLASRGELDGYLALLKTAHRPSNLATVMCRTLLSVRWDGAVYDCDFNQMLDLPLALNGEPRAYVGDLLAADFAGHPIRVADHCYGCTAGQGSSCGGALAAR